MCNFLMWLHTYNHCCIIKSNSLFDMHHIWHLGMHHCIPFFFFSFFSSLLFIYYSYLLLLQIFFNISFILYNIQTSKIYIPWSRGSSRKFLKEKNNPQIWGEKTQTWTRPSTQLPTPSPPGYLMVRPLPILCYRTT